MRSHSTRRQTGLHANASGMSAFDATLHHDLDVAVVGAGAAVAAPRLSEGEQRAGLGALEGGDNVGGGRPVAEDRPLPALAVL